MISSLKALGESISIYFQLSSHDSINSEPAPRYYKQGEEILKLVKPVLDAIFSFGVTCDEVLNKALEELHHYVEDLRDSFESWQPLLSKVYFVSTLFHMWLYIWNILFVWSDSWYWSPPYPCIIDKVFSIQHGMPTY